MQKKTHIKKGDLVKVLAGEDRAKEGRVLEVDRDRYRAFVEGLNINKVALWKRRAPFTSAT